MAISDPRDIPGLRLWLSADAITGYADNVSMTTSWTDLSGNGFNGTPNGTTKPKYRTTQGAASGPAVEFPNDGYFSFGNIMASAAAGEIMATVKLNTGDTGLWSFGQDTNNSDEDHYPFTGVVYSHFGKTTGDRQFFTPSLAISSWRRYNIWSASNDWAAQLDETSQVTDATNTVGWNTTPSIGAGQKNGGIDLKFSGWIGCVVTYNRKLTTQERSDLAAWLTANPSGGTFTSAVTVVQQKQLANSNAITLTTGATVGNILVVIGNLANNTGTDTPVTAISGVAGTWTKAIGLTQMGPTYSTRLEIWVGTTLTGGATAITMTGGAAGGAAWECVELSGINGSIVGSVTSTGTSTSPSTGSLTATGTSGRLMIAGIAGTSFGDLTNSVVDTPGTWANLTDFDNSSVTKIRNTGYREPTRLIAHSRTQTWASMDSWVGGVVELGAFVPHQIFLPGRRSRASLQRSAN